MRRGVTVGVLLFVSVLATGGAAQGASVCVPIDPGKIRCDIRRAADCNKINDYPYARNLFCPAAFNAVQTMVAEVASTLGVKGPDAGFFSFYQTLPDPQAPPDAQAQTTVACLDTPAPYPGGSKFVVGAGLPLCDLVARVTSPGPDDANKPDKDNPVPDGLRVLPDYFSKLYSPEKKFPLVKFKTGSVFDPIVAGLGASARDGFVADYRPFSPTALYLPDNRWKRESQYHGISGGGGGGWGGELAIVLGSGPVVQLTFGGGGGGGMTSSQLNGATTPSTSLGAGGGGGMQFGNGYRFQGKPYNGLGLGAGMGSGETQVQYSYNDYAGSGRTPQPVHQFNAPVISDYAAQLGNLADQLRASYKSHTTIVLRGGGGMGAGAEYLMTNGQEFEPHALSTQAGFQFSYEFHKGRAAANDPGVQALDTLNAEQEDVYAFIGDAFRLASQQAFEGCGRDYSNFDCICPRQHAAVICFVRQKVDDPSKIPAWLQERHCPGDTSAAGAFTSYQELLLTASTAGPSSCTTTLQQYFTDLNTPVDP